MTAWLPWPALRAPGALSPPPPNPQGQALEESAMPRTAQMPERGPRKPVQGRWQPWSGLCSPAQGNDT